MRGEAVAPNGRRLGDKAVGNRAPHELLKLGLEHIPVEWGLDHGPNFCATAPMYI